eukprot:CAMPEP_0176420526 /NCGR_PEP_ID=MMETSP0127-20121128/8653_1 /TAXON_ID=938130 /ORGANISM="Platyophrya macrostoma, Strain WH" /LENGTH=220 /DNA_ID=CAMNT_0017801127 /DNA_START=34 /DNA_END=694 /DNA_ORIENTATION=+
MADLEGNIQIGSNPASGFGGGGMSNQPAADPVGVNDQNTLDEPIVVTLKRDLGMIAYKLKYVMMPKAREEGAKELRNWDLWGPLLICLLLATLLSLRAKDKAQVIFGTIFVIIWIGACILTLNTKLLGGKISFFQSVCVLGYCVFPISVAALVLSIIHAFISVPIIISLILSGMAFVWSTFSSVGFMKALVNEEKKLLAAYPVLLFYLYLSWFTMIAGSE